MLWQDPNADVNTDIIHLDATNPRATNIGDLGQPGLLPENSFDCILLTNALHYVFDFRAAVRSLHLALKPGGVLAGHDAGCQWCG